LSKVQRSIREELARAYDAVVDVRDDGVSHWKEIEREKFWTCLRERSMQTLLDLGSGPGLHAEYFRDQGLDATCVDLSPAMVARCKEKGFEAYVCDAAQLKSLGRSFDSVFALNSLLHIPRDEMTGVLEAVKDTLNEDGLFYWGQYGGEDWQGILEEDEYEPKRFFSFMQDDKIVELARRHFVLQEFNHVTLEGVDSYHFQSLILLAL
jgi:SAM-dependent methyltransferase